MHEKFKGCSIMHSCMDVCFACQGASYPLPRLLLLAAPFITLRRAWSTTWKCTLRSKRLRHGKSMQNTRPTSNGTSRSAAMGHGTKTVCASSHRFDQRAMTIETCSPLQVEKDNPCWPPLKREAGEPMRITRGVGCHRFVLDMDNRPVYTSTVVLKNGPIVIP